MTKGKDSRQATWRYRCGAALEERLPRFRRHRLGKLIGQFEE